MKIVLRNDIAYGKLKDKRNWIVESNILFNALPKRWKVVLNSESALKTKSKINTNFHLYNKTFDTNFDVKMIYKWCIDKKFQKPIIQNFWKKKFNIDGIIWPKVWALSNCIYIENIN